MADRPKVEATSSIPAKPVQAEASVQAATSAAQQALRENTKTPKPAEKIDQQPKVVGITAPAPALTPAPVQTEAKVSSLAPKPALTPAPTQRRKPSPINAQALPASASGRAANDPREIKRRALAAQKEQGKDE